MAAIPPPPGTDLADSRCAQLLAATAATFAFGITAVILRFITRHCSGAGFWMDDYLIIPPALSIVAVLGIAVKLDNTVGRHVWAVGYTTQVDAMRYAFADEILYVVTLGATKLSVLALYWRIFKTSQIRLPLLITGFVVLAWLVASIIVTCLQCNPFEKNFNVLVPGTCIDIKAYFRGHATINILTDVVLLVLPIQPVFRIQKPMSQKAMIIGMFMCGGLVVVFSCLRLRALINIDMDSIDIMWNYTDTWIWSAMEENIAVFSVCLPTLRPLYKYLRTGSFRDQHTTARNSSKGSLNTALTGSPPHDWPMKKLEFTVTEELASSEHSREM